MNDQKAKPCWDSAAFCLHGTSAYDTQATFYGSLNRQFVKTA